MNINIRKASHIEIAEWPGGGYQVQFISSNGRRMGRPGVATTRHEAIEIASDWANQISRHSGYIMAVIETKGN